MAYSIEAGLQISVDGTTWYKLTDHNRKEIQANPTLIEKVARMANGMMRKYVVTKKYVIKTSWDLVPSIGSQTVDKNYSSAWMSKFYEDNVFSPVHVRLINAKDYTPGVGETANDNGYLHKSSKHGGKDEYLCFITNFSTTTVKRNNDYDLVNMEIEFTEI